MSESSGAQRYLHEQLRSAQSRYTYFLLAASASAIALALNQTHGLALAPLQAPLGAAVLSWGLSFFFGCRNVSYVNATLYANFDLVKVTSGQHPGVPQRPEFIAAAASGIREALDENIESANRFGKWQSRALILGALLYLGWHVLEMAARTPGLLECLGG